MMIILLKKQSASRITFKEKTTSDKINFTMFSDVCPPFWAAL